MHDTFKISRRPLQFGLLLIGLLAITTACGRDAVAPKTIAGSYALTRAGDVAAPGVIFDDTITDPNGVDRDFHLRIVATSGSLTLAPGGHYEHALDLAPSIDGVAQPTIRWRDRGQYTVRGDSVHFDSEYLQNVAFAASAMGQSLHVDQDVVGEGRAARFVFTQL